MVFVLDDQVDDSTGITASLCATMIQRYSEAISACIANEPVQSMSQAGGAVTFYSLAQLEDSLARWQRRLNSLRRRSSGAFGGVTVQSKNGAPW